MRESILSATKVSAENVVLDAEPVVVIEADAHVVSLTLEDGATYHLSAPELRAAITELRSAA